MANELKESEELFRNIFEDHTAVQMIIESETGVIVDVNKAAENFYGWKKAQLKQMKIQHINTLLPEETTHLMQNANARKQNYFEFQHRLANGTICDVEVFSSNITFKGKNMLHSIVHDITKRKRAEEEIRQEESRLESLLKINQYQVKSVQELLDFSLEEAISLTGSKIGYIYFYNEIKKEFRLNSWSKGVMDQCAVVESQTVYELENTGIWGEAVRQRKPVMINDFQTPDPLKKGVPKGHAPLYKFLTIPVFSGTQIVAVVGVANKIADYNKLDIRQLTLMMDAVWKIVKRVSNEKEISRSESRLRRAELASKSGNWELHLDSQKMYASEGANKLYGLESDSFSFSTIKDIPLPQYRKMLDSALKNLIDNNQPYNIEFKIKRPITNEIIDLHSIAIYDKQKGIVFGTIQDISIRKRMAEVLKESEEKFRTLFTQMAEGFALHELIYDESQVAVDYRIIEINSAFEKQVGISAEKAKGVLASDLYGVSPAPFLDIYTKVAETGNPYTFENYLSSIDRYFDISVFSPQKGLFATVFSDITESRRSEEKLIEEQEFNKMLIENLPGIFYIYSYPDLQLVRWNKNMEAMFGFNSEELKKRFSVDWPQPEVKENLNIAMHTVYNEGYVQMEVSLYRKDGNKIPVLLSAARFDAKDQTFIMGYGIDISDRKQADEALRKSEAQLREMNATKDKFFSIIAHDLKSPFNSILGLSDLLVEQIQHKDFTDIEKYAGIIQNSSKKAMDLLLNLLEWSRLQTGRIEFNPEYIELGSLINEVIELLNDSAQQKSITISKDMPPKVVVYVDKAMISTVLRNLLSNAIKFTNSDGKIEISVTLLKEELKVSVCDNGVGIEKKNLDNLFRIDQNYSTEGTQNEKGTGLGLILCKEFVEKHNGEIWVERNVSKGSKFSFSIPSIG